MDVRIVTATNQDLAQLVRDKRFREDLYYRLNVITVTTPPLRDRREDIRVLAQHFLRLYAAKNNRVLEGFSDEAMGCLEAYRWPGNVRELENVVERAVVLARGGIIEAANLPPNVTERSVTFTRTEPSPGAGGAGRGARRRLHHPGRNAVGGDRGARARGDAAVREGQPHGHRQAARHRPQDGLPQAQAGRGRGRRRTSPHDKPPES